MYCETCGVDASYCPPQPDGSYLCPGCAGIGEDTQPACPEPAPEPDTGGYISYTDGRVEPCYHLNGTHRDGSCVDCGYC